MRVDWNVVIYNDCKVSPYPSTGPWHLSANIKITEPRHFHYKRARAKNTIKQVIAIMTPKCQIRKGQDKEYYQAVLLRQQPAFCAASVRQT